MATITKDMILTLDDKENYFVAATAIDNDVNYGLLINVNQDGEYIIVKINDDTVEKINEDEYENLYSLLSKDLN